MYTRPPWTACAQSAYKDERRKRLLGNTPSEKKKVSWPSVHVHACIFIHIRADPRAYTKTRICIRTDACGQDVYRQTTELYVRLPGIMEERGGHMFAKPGREKIGSSDDSKGLTNPQFMLSLKEDKFYQHNRPQHMKRSECLCSAVYPCACTHAQAPGTPQQEEENFPSTVGECGHEE